MFQVWPVLFRKQNIVKGQRFPFKNESTPTVVRKLLHEKTQKLHYEDPTHDSETMKCCGNDTQNDKSAVDAILRISSDLAAANWLFYHFKILKGSHFSMPREDLFRSNLFYYKYSAIWRTRELASRKYLKKHFFKKQYLKKRIF